MAEHERCALAERVEGLEGLARSELRALQVSVAAMATSLVALTAIALVLRGRAVLATGGEDLAHVFLTALAFLGVAEAAGFAVIRRTLLVRLRARLRAGRDTCDAPPLSAELRALTVVGAAMAEGFGIFGAAVYLASGAAWALAASAVALALLVLQLPAEERLRGLVESVSHEGD
jgi:hypothetical protein